VASAVGFTFVYLFAAVIALIAVAITWPRRRAPGGPPLARMLAAAAFWAICDAVELHLPTAGGKRLISQIQYIGVITAAPFFFHAAWELAGRRARLSPMQFAAVWLVPILALLAAWTSQWHRWLWTDIRVPTGDLPFATYEYGWAFWVLTAQHYLLMVAASVMLLKAIQRVGRHYRIGMAAVLVAVVLPWAGNAAYNLKLGPWPGLNWLTLSLGLSGSLLVWVVLREGLLDPLPSAREALLERMTDGVIILDREDKVMFANEAAERMLPLEGGPLAASFGIPSFKHLPEQWRSEVQIERGGMDRWLDVAVDPVRDRWGAVAGRLLVVRDVSAQKMFEDEREQLIDELQAALRKVERLERLTTNVSVPKPHPTNQ
jgi:PAS domain-containing protein